MSMMCNNSTHFMQFTELLFNFQAVCSSICVFKLRWLKMVSRRMLLERSKIFDDASRTNFEGRHYVLLFENLFPVYLVYFVRFSSQKNFWSIKIDFPTEFICA